MTPLKLDLLNHNCDSCDLGKQKGPHSDMRRILIVLMLVSAFAGCSRSISDIWDANTRGKSHSDWWNANVGSSAVVGIVFNSIPGLHVPGLMFDTIYVYSSFDDIILGNGAIVARSYNCKNLVEDEDYLLFFGWQSEHRAEIEQTFLDIYKLKDKTIKDARAISNRLSSAALLILEKKVKEKVATKLSSKIGSKVIAKALLGFIPALGPLAAGIINYVILNPLHNDAIAYFQMKAKYACP